MVPEVYLVCGVSGSGKSWLCRQLKDKFNYVPHDQCWTHPTKKPDKGEDSKWAKGATSTHVKTIVEEAKKSDKPVLTECPFGERIVKEELEKAGLKVFPIFVIEDPRTVRNRYLAREKKVPGPEVLTRAKTIIKRADEWGSERGTSQQVLEILQSKEI